MSATFGTRGLEEPIPGKMLSTVGLAESGLVLKLAESGATLDVTTGITDAPVGVAVDETTNATTDALLKGERVSVLRHGVVPVRSAAVTWRRWDVAFLSTTDGYVTNVDGGSAKRVGTYVGEDNLAVALTDLVEIDLDSKSDINQ